MKYMMSLILMALLFISSSHEKRALNAQLPATGK